MYFASLGESIVREAGAGADLSSLPPPWSRLSFPGFRVPSITEVASVLQGLNAKKAAGPDFLPAKMLRLCGGILAAPLQDLVRTIIETCRYPRNLKRSLLHPVLKSGPATEISNFRPISLLPVADKVVERILCEQMSHFVETAGILSENQYGFRRGRNCEQAAMRVTEFVAQETDRGRWCIAIFCDISKAFDTVNHSRLCSGKAGETRISWPFAQADRVLSLRKAATVFTRQRMQPGGRDHYWCPSGHCPGTLAVFSVHK